MKVYSHMRWILQLLEEIEQRSIRLILRSIMRSLPLEDALEYSELVHSAPSHSGMPVCVMNAPLRPVLRVPLALELPPKLNYSGCYSTFR